MSDEDSDKGLFDFIKRIGGRAGVFITAVTTVYGAVRLLQGDAGLVTVILLIVGIGILWLTSFYFSFKKGAALNLRK